MLFANSPATNKATRRNWTFEMRRFCLIPSRVPCGVIKNRARSSLTAALVLARFYGTPRDIHWSGPTLIYFPGRAGATKLEFDVRSVFQTSSSSAYRRCDGIFPRTFAPSLFHLAPTNRK